MNRTLKSLLNRIPSDLPRSKEDFKAWSSELVEFYNIPDTNFYRSHLISMVYHLEPTQYRKAKSYFGATLKKLMVNQAAYDTAEEIKAANKIRQSGVPEVAEEVVSKTE